MRPRRSDRLPAIAYLPGATRGEAPEGRSPRRFGRWLAAGLAAAVLAGAGVPLARTLSHGPTPLSFQIVPGPSSADAADLRASPAATRLHFSDGSEIALEVDARAEVQDLGAHGARIVLAEGMARTYFVPRPQARWQVAAGPYLIEVTGTVFDVEWSEGNQSLDLWLRKGSVRVTGPLISGGVVMTHGQHLATRVRDNKFVLDTRLDDR
jgi:ferric-dicitrate binding protein FerR (iron transport regulator)